MITRTSYQRWEAERKLCHFIYLVLEHKLNKPPSLKVTVKLPNSKSRLLWPHAHGTKAALCCVAKPQSQQGSEGCCRVGMELCVPRWTWSASHGKRHSCVFYTKGLGARILPFSNEGMDAGLYLMSDWYPITQLLDGAGRSLVELIQ